MDIVNMDISIMDIATDYIHDGYSQHRYIQYGYSGISPMDISVMEILHNGKSRLLLLVQKPSSKAHWKLEIIFHLAEGAINIKNYFFK